MHDIFDSPDGAAPATGGSVPDSPAQRSAWTYVNPILDWDFPDPAVIHAPDGYYYAYATQTLRGENWVNIQVARSTDLIHWDHLGDALPDKPDWALETQDFWAPS